MAAPWLAARGELYQEQQKALLLSPFYSRVISGSSGSGKTSILVHRAAYLVRNWHVPVSRFMILTFTNALKETIQAGLQELGISQDSVFTFDKWCKTFHEKNIGRAPRRGRFSHPEATREAVDEYLRHEGQDRGLYDFILVDEGQDLEPVCYDILEKITRHVSVFMGQEQQIYSSRATRKDVLRALGLSSADIELSTGYRCNFCVAELAAEFLPADDKKGFLEAHSRPGQMDREKPLLFVARDFEQEMYNLLQILRARQSLGERIAVLFAERWQAEMFPKLCMDLGLYAEGPRVWPPGRKTKGIAHDFSSPRPKAMTYHSARGMTFDVVLMPRLTTRHFRGFLKKNMDVLLYTGVSRAVRWVYMSTVYEDMIKPVRTLYNGICHGLGGFGLEIRHGRFSRQKSMFEYMQDNSQETAAPKEHDPILKNEIKGYADLF